MKIGSDNTPDIGSLVASAETALSGLGTGWILPKKHIITDLDGADYKIRLYPDERQAMEREQLLREINAHIPMTPILGRQGRGLVFAYPKVKAIDPQDLSSFRSIGRFLAKLNKLSRGSVSEQQANQQVDLWLHEIARAGFISEHLIPVIRSTIYHLQPEGLKPCVDYLDPMPHNFCRWEEGFYVLDEKHFQIAFPGVGLVKPRLVMPSSHWAAVLQGYEEEELYPSDAAHVVFNEILYLLSALHFYSQLMQDGMADVPANPRLRRYRRILISHVLNSSGARTIELVRFWCRHPRETFKVARSRGFGKLRRLLGSSKEGSLDTI